MAGTSGDSSRRVSGILFGPRGILFRGIQDSLRTQGPVQGPNDPAKRTKTAILAPPRWKGCHARPSLKPQRAFGVSCVSGF